MVFWKTALSAKVKIKKKGIIVHRATEIKIASGCVFPTFCSQSMTPLLCTVIESKSGSLINRPRKVLYLAIVIYWDYKGRYIYINCKRKQRRRFNSFSLTNFEVLGEDNWFGCLRCES